MHPLIPKSFASQLCFLFRIRSGRRQLLRRPHCNFNLIEEHAVVGVISVVTVPQYRCFANSSSFGPILKHEGPSSRKAWRDGHHPLQEGDDDPYKHVPRKKPKELPPAIEADEKSWLVRFTDAQLQHPSLLTATRSSSKRATSKRKSADQRNSSHRRKMIYPIPKLEILSNLQSNIRKSVHTYRGTGHAIIGMNGSGKSLLLRALLYNNNPNINSYALSTTMTLPSSGNIDESNVAGNNASSLLSTRTKNNDEMDDDNECRVSDAVKDNNHDDDFGDLVRTAATNIDKEDESHCSDTVNNNDENIQPKITTSPDDNPYLVDASKLQFQSPNPNHQPLSIAYVSFESHQELLNEAMMDKTTTDNTNTVWSVLTKPMGGGTLSPGMQYLVVRFGLRPLLTHDVTTLSTGEIRKLLLIRALGQKPNILILDNAYDGLDLSSRQILDEVITQTLNGFQRSDILVQGVNVKDVNARRGSTYHNPTATQVVLLSHRPEEIHKKISRVTFLRHPKAGIPSTTEYRSNRTGKEMLMELAGYPPLTLGDMTVKEFARHLDDLTGLYDDPWFDTTLPSDEEILKVWWNGRSVENRPQMGQEIIRARYFNVRNHNDTKDLISNLRWQMKYGERWWISGLNGAGKSTLSKQIISTVRTTDGISPSDENDDEPIFRVSLKSSDVSYVSTERHMSLAKSELCGRDVIGLLGIRPSGVEPDLHNVPSYETIKKVMIWLNLPKSFLTRPFNELSQGEQKMLLIAGALSYRPVLLVLDEPHQGLDIANRHRVLGLVDRICKVTDISLIYITHHYEDLIPRLSHVIHLEKGKATFKGTVETFDTNNTLWSYNVKPVPEEELTEEEIENFDAKKKRKRRVWF